ncbi:hypothetical protein NUKP2_47110 [Klebsiella quasipneumoniae]|nr:hypothetical protein NUKP2_47110 [Klebsiella quasipneumoniae]GKP39998.1 hypothetical protein NUKP28_42020 [Klebsiella quasipneumoniae]
MQFLQDSQPCWRYAQNGDPAFALKEIATGHNTDEKHADENSNRAQCNGFG